MEQQVRLQPVPPRVVLVPTGLAVLRHAAASSVTRVHVARPRCAMGPRPEARAWRGPPSPPSAGRRGEPVNDVCPGRRGRGLYRGGAGRRETGLGAGDEPRPGPGERGVSGPAWRPEPFVGAACFSAHSSARAHPPRRSFGSSGLSVAAPPSLLRPPARSRGRRARRPREREPAAVGWEKVGGRAYRPRGPARGSEHAGPSVFSGGALAVSPCATPDPPPPPPPPARSSPGRARPPEGGREPGREGGRHGSPK